MYNTSCICPKNHNIWLSFHNPRTFLSFVCFVRQRSSRSVGFVVYVSYFHLVIGSGVNLMSRIGFVLRIDLNHDTKNLNHEIPKDPHPTLNHFTYRLRFPATRCLRDWRWYQARRAPSTRAQSPGPRRMCSPPLSVCAPLSARTARQSRCCLLWPGDGGEEVLAWRREIPSVKKEVRVEREEHTRHFRTTV